MAAPSVAITRFDLSLSYAEFSLMQNQRNFVGLKVLPPVPVGMQSADFERIKIESILTQVENTERAPKSGYSRSDYEWDKDHYSTADHGVEEVIDDRQIKMYGNEIRAEQIHAQRGYNRVLQAYESSAAKLLFNPTTFAAYLTAIAIPWTTPATATPINDIDNAIEAVIGTCGTRPNAIVLTDYALTKFARTAQFQDLVKFSGKDDPKIPWISEALKALFMFDRIIVAKAVTNTADKGQAAAVSRLWDPTMAMVCHVHDSMDVEDPAPRVGATMMWTEENAAIPGADSDGPDLIVEEYREEGVRGGIQRHRCDYQQKLIHLQSARLLTAVTA